MGYWATHRPQVNYTLSLCVCTCSLTYVCMCFSGPPVVLGKLHTWVSPYVSSETTRPSAPLQLSHGPDSGSCCHRSLFVTHKHRDNLTVWQLLGNITLQAADSWSWTGAYHSRFNSEVLCGAGLAALPRVRSSFPVGAKASWKCLDKSVYQVAHSSFSRTFSSCWQSRWVRARSVFKNMKCYNDKVSMNCVA